MYLLQNSYNSPIDIKRFNTENLFKLNEFVCENKESLKIESSEN